VVKLNGLREELAAVTTALFRLLTGSETTGFLAHGADVVVGGSCAASGSGLGLAALR
jgi:hypothetical protein